MTDSLTTCVWLISYNHEAFIAQSIESVLMQKTNFNYHLIIGEDCSTDRTREICQSYAKKYPEKITLHLSQKNIGANQNAKIIYKACFESGAKYVAILEGDDYWTDPYKLQKQVDFLENDNKAILVFHNALKLFSDGKTSRFNTYDKTRFDSNDLWNQWLIPTASVLYRNIPLDHPDWFWKSTHGDLGLFLLLGEHGDFGCINEVMCVYRIHETGVTSSDFKSIDHKLKHIEQLKAMDCHFNLKFHKQIAKRLISYYLSASYLLARKGNKKKVIKLIQKSLGLKFYQTLKNQYFYKTLFYLLFSWNLKNL